MKLNTSLVHLGQDLKLQNGHVSPPLYRGSTVIYPDAQALRNSEKDVLKLNPPYYGRFGSPTTRSFEKAICELEGGFGAVSTCSGLSAITTAILALVESGDHLLVSDSVYQPTRNFCESIRRFGIETEYYSPTLGSEIKNRFRSNTRLVFLESPGSLTLEIQDVPAIAKECNQQGVTTLMDNTWATPLFFQPLKHGVDISIHSATKYITGHADSFLGVIICNKNTFDKVKTSANRLGQHANAEDIHSGIKGLKTLSIRMKQHQQQALAVIHGLKECPEITDFFYPGLPESPGHEIWKRDFSGASGLFSVQLDKLYPNEVVDRMLDSLRIFALGHSWGGFESLLVPVRSDTRSMLRLHVGFEDPEDLIADFKQALLQLHAGETSLIR